MFYLTITAKRKNAKRHIAQKSNNLDELRDAGKKYGRYITEIYNGKWELIEKIQ